MGRKHERAERPGEGVHDHTGLHRGAGVQRLVQPRLPPAPEVWPLKLRAMAAGKSFEMRGKIRQIRENPVK